jgi:ATP-dependent Lon protease
LEGEKEFGIVYFSGNNIKRVGCTAQILKVLKHYDNGEMDIITIGMTRFIIKELIDTRSFLQATIIPFEDEPEEENHEIMELATSGIESLRELNRLAGSEWDSESLEESDVKKISFLISGNEGFTPEEKQQLLEMTSTKKRLKNGLEALGMVLERKKLTLEIQEIIKANGDVSKLLMKYGLE